MPGWDSHEFTRSEDRQYIHAWLEQIKQSSPETLHESSPTALPQPWRPYGLPVCNKPCVDKADLRRQEARNWATRDSPLRSLSSPSECTDDRQSLSQSFNSGARDDTINTYEAERRQFVSCQESFAAAGDRFEKRPRRKTRDDRYETKKKKKATAKRKLETSETEQQPNLQQKQLKEKSTKKLRSGKDIMSNFTSTAIPSRNIIIKPNLTTGLFSNARIPDSDDMADLRFNEMRFLDRKKLERNNSAQRFREKDCKQREKDLKYESEFFECAGNERQRQAEIDRYSHQGHEPVACHRPSTSQGQELEDVSSTSVPKPLTDDQGLRGVVVQEETKIKLVSPGPNSQSKTSHMSWPSSHDRPPQSPEEMNGDYTGAPGLPIPLSALNDLIDTGVFDFARMPVREAAEKEETPMLEPSPLVADWLPKETFNTRAQPLDTDFIADKSAEIRFYDTKFSADTEQNHGSIEDSRLYFEGRHHGLPKGPMGLQETTQALGHDPNADFLSNNPETARMYGWVPTNGNMPHNMSFENSSKTNPAPYYYINNSMDIAEQNGNSNPYIPCPIYNPPIMLSSQVNNTALQCHQTETRKAKGFVDDGYSMNRPDETLPEFLERIEAEVLGTGGNMNDAAWIHGCEVDLGVGQNGYELEYEGRHDQAEGIRFYGSGGNTPRLCRPWPIYGGDMRTRYNGACRNPRSSCDADDMKSFWRPNRLCR